MLILLIAIATIFVIISFALQVIFHELGHYFFGKLTGWKLIYLQLWRILFYHDVKRDKYIFKSVPWKGYQCIMKPNKIDCFSDAYSLGGLFFNFLLSGFGLIVMIKIPYKMFPFLFFLSFTLSGIVLLITNGIPMVKNLCNDMACFLLTKSSKTTSQCHNAQLVIAGELAKGKTYAMMSEDIFFQEIDSEINDITAYSHILNYYYHLDRDEFQAAHKQLIKINDFSKISNNIFRIYKLEIFYLYMVMSLYVCRPLISPLLPDRENEMCFVKENAISGDLHSLRVRIMCQAYFNMNDSNINGAIDILEKGADEISNTTGIYLGEKLFCEDQLMAVCNMLKRMS